MVELIGNDEHFILISLLLTVCMQMGFFDIAYMLQIDKVTDFAGTSNFLVLAVFTLWLSGEFVRGIPSVRRGAFRTRGPAVGSSYVYA